MSVAPSFEGYFKYGEWLPLWVTLENKGPNLDVQVQTRINQSTGWVTFAKNVSLPSGSRKQITLYALPNNYSREIVVQVISDNREILSQVVEVVPNQNDHLLIGIAAPQWGPLSQISGLQFEDSTRETVLVNLQLDQIPDQSAGLKSLDVIILNDVDTGNLDNLQKIALENWVTSGGFLILGGGSGLNKLYIGLPKSLVNFEPAGLKEISTLPALEKFADNSEILLNGPFTISHTSLQGGTTLLTEENSPIVHQWNFGEGNVTFVALNLIDSPFNAWSGTPAFWDNLLNKKAYYPVWMPRDVSARQMRGSSMAYPLSNLPVLDLPSVQGLGILLIIYIILIGPTNYFILKGQNKLHLAWITIPALTAIFAVGAFGLAFSLRGNDIVTNKLSIISLRQDGSARIDSYIGVFSPAQESFEIAVSGDMLLSPSGNGYYDPWISAAPASAGETVFLQDNPARVVGLDINQWSMQSFNSENISANLGKISSNLFMSGNLIKGEIQNQLESTLSDTVLIVGNEIIVIGNLEPGESRAIEFSFSKQSTDIFRGSLTYQILDSTYPTGSFDYSRDYELKRSILDNVFQPYGYWIGPTFEVGKDTNTQDMFFQNIYLLGWLTETPPEVSINGKDTTQSALALLSTHLPIQLQQGEYTIPAALIEGEITRQPLNGGFCGGSATHVYMDFGSSEFEFNIPNTILDTEIEHLIIGYSDETSQWNNIDPEISLSLYNWEELEWIAISNLKPGNNTIANFSNYINSYGTVRVQAEREAQNIGGCIMVSLGLEGVNP
jgi:hypothetical protein